MTSLDWYHEEGQYKHIHRPYYEAVSISISHVMYALNKIRQAGDFDIIHDHNSYIGPAVLAYAVDLPPILHTLHEPFTDARKLESGIPDNRLMFDQFKSIKNLYFNTVSEKQRSLAPQGLRSRIMGTIYNGINLSDYIYDENKEDYFTVVASISPDKGQATAARICSELGVPLKIAGTIGGEISTAEESERLLANQTSVENSNAHVRYFLDQVAPYLEKGRIEFVGKVTGHAQKKHFAKAKAMLFPIDWEEPFGMAVIEALASGTPVVAFRRGAMPEIIEHGVNGFLADTYDEFKWYVQQTDKISPAECRKSVEQRFSVDTLSSEYASLYNRVITKHRALIKSGKLYRNVRQLVPLFKSFSNNPWDHFPNRQKRYRF